jgi:acetolactate synthase-1/2/3 large subunit
MPLTGLRPSPDFTRTAEASRAWARRVEDPAALPALLQEAVRVVLEDRRPALLDVQVGD